MVTIGITGNSGSGKSTFSKVLASKLDAVIIDADKIAKKTSEQGKEYYNKIVEEFGEEILKENEIDRKKLANIIYKNEEKRNKLNFFTNKYVVEKIKQEIEKNKNKNIIMDVPLLFESGLDKECNITISLVAKENVKLERMIKRDNIDENIAKQRLDIQKPDEYYIEKSNYIIVNNKSNLEQEAEEFIKTINILNDEIVIINNENVKYMQLKKLLKYRDIAHCFTLKPMDFGDNKTYKNKEKEIKNNYKKICEELQVNCENVVRPYQTHTDNIRKIENENGIYIEELTNVDGLMTDKNGKVLSLTFADCIPIYLFDKEKNIIALVHSGWVGTTKKILKNAIEKLNEEYKCDVKDLICAFGPSIRQCHFEVDADVRNIFYETFKEMKNINEIIKDNKETGKSYIDTIKINKNILKEKGILEENIIDCNVCTLCNCEVIHSYRKEGKSAGRNTAILCLK